MAQVSIVFGILLVVLGAGAYFATGSESVTALIPAFFGLPIAALGFWARNPARLKAAMHGAVVIALLGFLGSARGIPGAVALAQGNEVARPAAALAQTAMAAICLIFLVLSIRSFAEARRARG